MSDRATRFTAMSCNLFALVWADCRAAVANGNAGEFEEIPRGTPRRDLENPLGAPPGARALLKDHIPTLIARREELGLTHEDVAAIMWGVRRLDWASARHRMRIERKKRGASCLHVAEVQFPEDFGGSREIQKWETGQRIPNAMSFIDWCTALGLEVDVRPMEEVDATASE